MAAIWTEQQVSELRAFSDQGLSASQAAAHFVGMTRNSAVGLAFRKGFHFHGKGGGSHHHAKPKSRMFRPKRAYLECLPTEPEPVISLRPGMLTIHELEADSCRYIMGDVRDPNHRYCGQKQINGYSWCQFHAALVYETPEQRNATIRAATENRLADRSIHHGRTR